MEISEGVKQYLDDLLRTYSDELKSEIEDLKLLVSKKNEQIRELNEKVIEVVQRNVQVSDELNQLRERSYVKIDDLEQYGRKNSLRIEGIAVADKETSSQLTDKVVATLNSMGAAVTSSDFFRLHRSGKPHTKGGRRVAQTIVRFQSWEARTRAYKTRFFGTSEERKERPYFVRQDLTKRRLSLLNSAQNALHDHPFAHAYSDGECNLLAVNRSTKEKFRFNTTFELHEALGRINAFNYIPPPDCEQEQRALLHSAPERS